MSVESLMPKGVEHNRLDEQSYLKQIGVESLMPKGVEHIKCYTQSIIFLLCRISDAERR